MVYDGDVLGGIREEFGDEAGGVLRDGDDVVGTLRSVLSELPEAQAKLGSGVVCRHNEQVVESRDGAREGARRESLIEAMEEIDPLLQMGQHQVF